VTDTSIRLRKLALQQIPAILDLWRDAGLTIRPQGREHPDTLRHELKTYPDNYIGAFAGDRLVGVVVATWDGRRGWINRLAVHPDCRRRGLARRLIQAAEEELRGRGALVIGALIEPENDASLTLFRDAGYTDMPAALYLSKRENLNV
jgi:ribosomal protein S18 acetylase RimI-like enzyme